MANTSPRHIPVLGNVHLIKIETLIFYHDIYLLVGVFISSASRKALELF